MPSNDLNLKPINTTIIQTMMIDNLANALAKFNVNNSIYLIKTGMIMRYKRLEVIMDNNEKYVFTDISDVKNLRMLNNISKVINTVIITTYNDSILHLTKRDIYALRGIKLCCHTELAIEYYRYIINQILYDNKDLLRYCSRNHLLDDDGVNLLELLDYEKGSLTEDDVFHISNAIKDIPTLTDVELMPIRRIANGYKYNPKRVSFNRYAITIDIYDDVRVIRFNELSERKEQSDNENVNSFSYEE